MNDRIALQRTNQSASSIAEIFTIHESYLNPSELFGAESLNVISRFDAVDVAGNRIQLERALIVMTVKR